MFGTTCGFRHPLWVLEWILVDAGELPYLLFSPTNALPQPLVYIAQDDTMNLITLLCHFSRAQQVLGSSCLPCGLIFPEWSEPLCVMNGTNPYAWLDLANLPSKHCLPAWMHFFLVHPPPPPSSGACLESRTPRSSKCLMSGCLCNFYLADVALLCSGGPAGVSRIPFREVPSSKPTSSGWYLLCPRI